MCFQVSLKGRICSIAHIQSFIHLLLSEVDKFYAAGLTFLWLQHKSKVTDASEVISA